MPNYSDRTTDKELEILEKRLAQMYQQAAEELNEKWDQYVNAWDEEIDDKIVHHKGVTERYKQEYQAYQRGAYTKEQFDEWYKAQIGRGKRWEAMRDQMTDRMMRANDVACSYVNDKTPGIYTLNHNYSLYQIESVHPNVSFTLADENTIKRMASQKNHVNFRVLKMDRKRDYKWNKTRISNALAQGILQGENPKKIAKRFMGVMESNHAAAVRNARTAFTSAQNGGRIDSYQKASEMGIEIQKEWLATSDNRTRDTHVKADGQRQPWDKPFQLGHGTLKYPGDPAGHPAEVYNCRCTVVPVLPDQKNEKNFTEWYDKKIEEGQTARDRLGLFGKRKTKIESNNDVADPKYYDFKGKSLKTIEDEITNLDYEVGVCVDKNGNAIFAQLGNSDTIEFTEDELNRFKGSIVTHNHPLSTPPSPDDLYLVKDHKCRQFRTCGKNGTYVIEYDKNVKKLPEWEELFGFYNKSFEKHLNSYHERIENGMKDTDSLIILGEEIWMDLNAEYGVNYRWEGK